MESKFLSFKTAKSSTIIQFLASLMSEFFITSSKYFEISNSVEERIYTYIFLRVCLDKLGAGAISITF